MPDNDTALINAAPELLSSLVSLCWALQDEVESNLGREATGRDMPREWYVAQAAIKKARGESP